MRRPILKKSNFIFAIIGLCVFSSTFLNADIVFLSDRDGKVPVFECEVYTMDDYGGNAHRLTTDLLYKARPAWSPNGSKIAFAVEIVKPRQKDWGPDQTVELFLMSAGGKNKKQVTNYKYISSHPTWSPDGRSIAFASAHTGNLEIHRIDLGNGRVSQITNSLAETGGYAQSPDWSPDGNKIVYALALPGAGSHIYITDIRGKNTRPLVKRKKLEIGLTHIDAVPKWHPDSEHILYRTATIQMVEKGNEQVLEIVDEGSLEIRRESEPKSQKLMIPDALVFRTGCWAEGGNAVIFTASDDNNPDNPTDIYRYDMFTHAVRNISNHPAHDYSPHWVDPTYPIYALEKLTTQWAQLKK